VRLTSKTAYGVQALFDMAFHGAGRAVQAREVAERQAIPLRYLEQILQELRRAGFVEAKRGPGGGYALARPPEAVSLRDVAIALDGPLESLLATEEGTEANITGEVWRELGAAVSGMLGALTVRDLVARAEARNLSRAPAAPQMYFI
jgi:Rrf2 family iron-sulfur cluster assembly transcriptional regulator